MAKPILAADHFRNEEAAFAFLEAHIWPDRKPICPKCGVVDRAKRLHGKTTRAGLWKCYACMKPFTVKVGTVFGSAMCPCISGFRPSTSSHPARRASARTKSIGPWASP